MMIEHHEPKYISEADRLAFEIKGIETYLEVLKERQRAMGAVALKAEVTPERLVQWEMYG